MQASALRLTDEGYLWVRHFSRLIVRGRETPPDESRWTVFTPAGRWLGEIATPARFEVRSIHGDLVFGVWKDEFLVEEVRAYRILGYAGDG